MRTRITQVLPAAIVAIGIWLAAGAALAQQPCQGQVTTKCTAPGCIQATVAGGTGAVGDVVNVPVTFAQGTSDGGADNIAALAMTVSAPSLELVGCDEEPTADGLTSGVEVPGDAAYRVVIENTSCTNRTRCLCPKEAGQTRDPFINIVVFGPKVLPTPGQGVTIPPLPSAQLLNLKLKIATGATGTLPLHIYAEDDNTATDPTKPDFAACLSVGDVNAVDQTADRTASVSKVKTTNGSVIVSTTCPLPCAGDCDGNQSVEITDIVTAVGFLLSQGDPSVVCLAIDQNCNQMVEITEIVTAVGRLLAGGQCPAVP